MGTPVLRLNVSQDTRWLLCTLHPGLPSVTASANDRLLYAMLKPPARLVGVLMPQQMN